MLLSGDTSENIICIVIGDKSEITNLVMWLRIALLGQRDRSLHMRLLPSKIRRVVVNFVSRNIDIILSKIRVIIISCLGKFKQFKTKIFSIIANLVKKEHVTNIVLTSDFDQVMKGFSSLLRKMTGLNILIDDEYPAVELADILANTHRRNRKLMREVTVYVLR